MGPCSAMLDHGFCEGWTGTRPLEGRNPTTLQKLAGLRRDAPRSEPSAKGSMPQATATAAPPDEPPQVFSVSYGLRVIPNTALNVCEPAPSSGVLVLPSVIAPADRSRSTSSASSAGTWSRKIGEPSVVRIPLVATRSL